MSKYTPTVKFEIVFEDDTVTMKLKQLSRKTFLGWMPYFSKTDADGKLSSEDTLKLVNEAADIIPDHVTDFEGLRDANGNAIPLDIVVNEVYFIELISQIVMKLIEICQVGQGIEEVKSDGPPEASSTV